MVATHDVEVAVLGGGPAGLATALLMARAGIATALVAAPPEREDPRTTALLSGSLKLLEHLEIWPGLKPETGPLERLRIIDDTRRILRAPEVLFEAAELGLEAFGYNIPNRRLVAALRAAAAAEPKLLMIQEKAEAVRLGERAAALEIAGGRRLTARLLAAADGRHSMARAAAGIGVSTRRYPQVAMALNTVHEHRHERTSTEFHTVEGPFTLVPLPGLASSVVWVVSPERAESLAERPPALFDEALTERAHRLLGRMSAEGPVGRFPLVNLVARRFAARRVALVGEAAHALPPIGAQGLNLGLRDAAHLAEIVAAARAAGLDPGGERTLARYDTARRGDVWARSLAVDALNRSLLSTLPFGQLARGLGLAALGHIPPLRRAVMREGLLPGRGAPALMAG